MKIIVTIDTDTGAAFDDPGHEVARILRDIAKQAEFGDYPVYLRDINGNKCGTVEFED